VGKTGKKGKCSNFLLSSFSVYAFTFSLVLESGWNDDDDEMVVVMETLHPVMSNFSLTSVPVLVLSVRPSQKKGQRFF